VPKALRDRVLAGEVLTLEDFTADSFLHADLYLYGCTGLRALPEGLAVGGGLWLNGCTGLRALPEGLAVGGSLYLDGCTGLKGVRKPSGVKGAVYR